MGKTKIPDWVSWIRRISIIGAVFFGFLKPIIGSTAWVTAAFLLLVYSMESIISAIVYREAGGPGGLATAGKFAIIWGFIRFVFFGCISVLVYLAA